MPRWLATGTEYLSQFFMLLVNSFLGGLCLYFAFRHLYQASVIEYTLFAAAIFTVTFGLTAKKMTLEHARSLGLERLSVNIAGLSTVLVLWGLWTITTSWQS